jgi:hypothetical protein
VHMHHLHHGQQREQDQTQHGHQRQRPTLRAAFPAPKCLKSYQHTCPLL